MHAYDTSIQRIILGDRSVIFYGYTDALFITNIEWGKCKNIPSFYLVIVGVILSSK